MNHMITMKRILLMMMAVLAALYAAASSKDQPVLNDLTGEIVFEEGGNKTTALTDDGGLIDMYEYLYISYSGDEDVEFTILVNDRNLLEDEDLNHCVSWDEDNKRYVVSLYYLISPFGDQYCAFLNFVVTVHSAGYNDLTMEHSSFVSFILETDGLSILEIGCTDLSCEIEVGYGYSHHYCNLDGIYPYQEGDWGRTIYGVERLDHDYYLTVRAGHRTMRSTVYSYIEKTILIPARECDITISQYENIKPGCVYSIIENESCYYTDKELSECFAIIESDSWGYLGVSVSIDGEPIGNSGLSYGDIVAINLLPFGNIFGGEHYIEATISDGYNSLTTDTVLEIHPVVTRLTRDSLFLDIAPNMNNITLLVNGEEVEISTEGNYYALERLDQDYSVTVQAEVNITDVWGEDYSRRSKETTIIIPSKSVGDVDDNGLVNISDVTALIDYLLNNDASAINLTNADCDGNGLVNISDVTSLIDYLLSGTWH